MKTCAAVIYFSVLWYILYINLYTTYFSLYIFCMPSSCLRSLVNVVCGTLAGQGQGIAVSLIDLHVESAGIGVCEFARMHVAVCHVVFLPGLAYS
jgi:hypothetical protein